MSLYRVVVPFEGPLLNYWWLLGVGIRARTPERFERVHEALME